MYETKRMVRAEELFGRIIPLPDGTYSHINCVRWCINVVERGGTLINAIPLKENIYQARMCCVCGQRRACITCSNKACAKFFHVGCAMTVGKAIELFSSPLSPFPFSLLCILFLLFPFSFFSHSFCTLIRIISILFLLFYSSGCNFYEARLSNEDRESPHDIYSFMLCPVHRSHSSLISHSLCFSFLFPLYILFSHLPDSPYSPYSSYFPYSPLFPNLY